MFFFLVMQQPPPLLQLANESCSERVRYVPSIRGNTLLELDGQTYTLNRKKDKSYYWECVKKRNKNVKCSSRIVTIDGNVKSIRGTHNHDFQYKYKMEN